MVMMPDMNKLRDLREAKQLSQQALADLVGSSAPQINRLEKGERRLSDVWLDKLAPALGVSRAAILGEAGGKSISISGSVQAGVWNGDNAFYGEEIETISLPEPLHAVPGISALKVRGDSMDIFFPEGSIVFVQDIHAFNQSQRAFFSGEYVVVRRCNDDGQWETTLKEFNVGDDGVWRLIPRSRNASHKPLVYYPEKDTPENLNSASADTLHIAGVVLASLALYNLPD